MVLVILIYLLPFSVNIWTIVIVLLNEFVEMFNELLIQ